MEPFLTPNRISLAIIASGMLTLIGVATDTLDEFAPGEASWPHFLPYLLIGIIFIIAALPAGFRPGIYHLLIALGCLVAHSTFYLFPNIHGSIFTSFFVFSGIAALILPVRPALSWVAFMYLSTLLAVGLMYGRYAVFSWLSSGGGFLFFAFFGIFLRHSNDVSRKARLLSEELKEANGQLLATRRQAAQLAVAEERNRLAREMHDSLGHRLTVAVVQLEGAQRLIPSEPRTCG